MLRPKEIIIPVLREFKQRSTLYGLGLEFLVYGVIILIGMLPFFLDKEAEFLSDLGGLISKISGPLVLFVAIIMVLLSFCVASSYKELLKKKFKKDYPDWEENKAKEKGRKIAKLYRRTFCTMNWYGFLGLVVFMSFCIEVFQMLSRFFFLSATFGGFFLFMLWWLDFVILIYLKDLVARVVYDKHKDEVAAEEDSK